MIAKLYPSISSTASDILLYDILSLEISNDINNIDTATMTIPVVPWLYQYRKVEIINEENNDALIFRWYIDNIVPSIDHIDLKLKSEKAILNKKLVLANASFTGQTVSAILTSLFWSWNSAYSETWTVSCPIATTVTKSFSYWDNFFSICEELSWLIGAVWTVSWNQVIIDTLLWDDRTNPTSANFYELVYNTTDPLESNIRSVTVESYGTISNVIIWDDWSSKTTKSDPTSIATFWALWETKNFRTGDLSNQTQKYLDSKKSEQKVFKIVPDIDVDLNCWDKVNLRIETDNPYLAFSWSVIVNTKNTKFVNWTPETQYGLSESYAYFDTFINKMNNITDTVNLLKI